MLPLIILGILGFVAWLGYRYYMQRHARDAYLAAQAEDSASAAPSDSPPPRMAAPAPCRPAFAIPDNYGSFEELQAGLRAAGLESSNLILAIDYTKSNTWNGAKTFGDQPLHKVSEGQMNPYETAIELMCKTLEAFDDDNVIPVFGFGDDRTRDHSVFTLSTEAEGCKGLPEVLGKYREVTPKVVLSGPTSFAPVIRKAVEIVKARKQYHILVIIADGQVTNLKPTKEAIVEASNYPLSIIVIGVGDGPWEDMRQFDEMEGRRFDNFQFVPFHDTMTRSEFSKHVFALHALMEIPEQYKAICKLGLL
jgi:hypothetical protein